MGTFVKIALQLLAGIGIGGLVDKVAADKLPSYEPVSGDVTPGTVGFKPAKLLYMVLIFAGGAMLLQFIGKKLNIKLFKK